MSQYADDTTFFLDGTKESFCSCIKVLQQFALMSGLRMNYDKSTAVWIGSLRNSRVRYMPELKFVWNPAVFKVLGVIFSVNISDIVQLNYDDKLVQIRKILNSWSRRNITPFGKITVIKTLALSKLTHLFMSLPDPHSDFLDELNKLLFAFLWNGKTDKVKRVVTFQPFEAGGLKMIDVKCFLAALKITWLRKILCDNGKITN